MLFKYKGLNQEAQKISGRIEAPSLEDAKKRLQAQGILFEQVTASSEGLLQKLSALRRVHLPTKTLSNFSRNLAIYLKAGIPLIQALKLLKNDSESSKLSDFLTAVETMIEEGKSFYAALEAQKVVSLPSFYKQSIKVAEENGLLAVVLKELSSFLKEQERMAKQIKKALTYPLFILFIATIMVAIMLTVVVPKITAMFTQMHKSVPPLTQFVIDAGDFLSKEWLVLSLAFMLFFALFKVLKTKVYRFKFALDLALLKLPFFGKMVRTSELARFSYIASMLLRSGVPFVHTVSLASNILNSYPIQKKLSTAARYVVEGKKFSQALLTAGFTQDRAFLQAIALGEETSELPQMLENLSELYAQDNQDRTDTFLALLEPMLILTVGLIMGVIVSAMLLPIFSLNLGL